MHPPWGAVPPKVPHPWEVQKKDRRGTTLASQRTPPPVFSSPNPFSPLPDLVGEEGEGEEEDLSSFDISQFGEGALARPYPPPLTRRARGRARGRVMGRGDRLILGGEKISTRSLSQDPAAQPSSKLQPNQSQSAISILKPNLTNPSSNPVPQRTQLTAATHPPAPKSHPQSSDPHPPSHQSSSATPACESSLSNPDQAQLFPEVPVGERENARKNSKSKGRVLDLFSGTGSVAEQMRFWFFL